MTQESNDNLGKQREAFTRWLERDGSTDGRQAAARVPAGDAWSSTCLKSIYRSQSEQIEPGKGVLLGVTLDARAACLDEEELFRHVLILGSIGSGKTTGGMKPIVQQMMSQTSKPGLLILESGKDNYAGFAKASQRTVQIAAAPKRVEASRNLRIISPSESSDRLNLVPIHWSAGKIASALSCCFGQSHSDPYWESAARSFLDALIRVRKLMSMPISLADLQSDFAACTSHEDEMEQRTVNRENVRESQLAVYARRLGALSVMVSEVGKLREIAQLQARLLGFYHLASRTLGCIMGTIEPLFDCTAEADVIETLCCQDIAMTCSLEEVFSGDAFIVDMPRQLYGNAGVLAGRLLKRQVYTFALERARTPQEGKERPRPVYVVSDEAHLLADYSDDPEGDIAFASIARSMRVGLMWSTQSLEQFYSGVPHNRLKVTALLRQFRTLVVYQSDLSPELDALLAERGVSVALRSRVPFLRPYEALVVRDGKTDFPPQVVVTLPTYNLAHGISERAAWVNRLDDAYRFASSRVRQMFRAPHPDVSCSRGRAMS